MQGRRALADDVDMSKKKKKTAAKAERRATSKPKTVKKAAMKKAAKTAAAGPGRSMSTFKTMCAKTHKRDDCGASCTRNAGHAGKHHDIHGHEWSTARG